MVLHPCLRRFLRHAAEEMALARAMRRGRVADAAEAFDRAWAGGLSNRLRFECETLAPLGTPRLAARLITSVGAMRDLAASGQRDESTIRELGVRLEDYLHWKERELLPMLEVVATPSELDRLSRTRAIA